MSAADTSVLVRAVIAAVGARHGFRTSFSPKVAVPGVGNGGHVHLSLWRSGANLMAGGPDARFGLTADGEAFAAGVLEHLPALMAVGAPGVTSYLRHAAVPLGRHLRLLGPGEPRGRRAHGHRVTRRHGVGRQRRGQVLRPARQPVPGVRGRDRGRARRSVVVGASLPDPVDVDPAVLATVELASRGIGRLPTSLREAVDAFAADAVVQAPSARRCRRRSSRVRESELELFDGAADEAVAAATRWQR